MVAGTRPSKDPAPALAGMALAAAMLAPALGWSAPADAQVRQCQGAAGDTVFTDRSCDDVGAVAAVPGASITDRRLHNGCARDVRELVWEVSTAIDRRDVNRLAGVYHWTGMSGSSGNSIMERLQRIVASPLLNVTPVVHRPPPRAWSVLDDGRVPRVAAAAALQLDQLGPDGGSTRTTFDLREHFGCVWIAG